MDSLGSVFLLGLTSKQLWHNFSTKRAYDWSIIDRMLIRWLTGDQYKYSVKLKVRWSAPWWCCPGPGDLFIFVSNSSGPDHGAGVSAHPHYLRSLMTVTWLPASLSNTEISNPLNIFCHLKIQCFVAGVSSTSGGFEFRELNFFDILQLDNRQRVLDLSEDAATVRCLKYRWI